MPVTWGAMTVGDRRLARLLNSFPEIVVVLDGSGNVLWANHLAEVLFDRPLESSIGMSGIDLVHPDDLEIVLRSLETVQSKSVGAPLEIRAKIGNDWRLIELIGSPVPWFEKGAVLFSIRDLTDRRRFELARSPRRSDPPLGHLRRRETFGTGPFAAAAGALRGLRELDLGGK